MARIAKSEHTRDTSLSISCLVKCTLRPYIRAKFIAQPSGKCKLARQCNRRPRDAYFTRRLRLSGWYFKSEVTMSREQRSMIQSVGDSFSKAPYFWLFLCSILIRLVYSAESMANPLFGAPLVDASVYDQWANRIVAGDFLWNRVGNYTPVYPFFLALIKSLCGDSFAAVRLVQFLMGAGTAILMGKVAEHLWNRRTGILTAALLSVNWMMVIYDGEEYAESFSIFFQSMAVWLLFCRRGGALRYLAMGLCFALSVGARANLLLCLPAILLWLFIENRQQRRALLINTAALGLGMIVVLGPILARNHQLTGKWMMRAQASWSLYAAITPEYGGLHPPAGVRFDNFMRQPIQKGLRSEQEIENFWWNEVVKLVREQPGAVVVTTLKRLIVFLNAREWSQEFDVYAYRAYSSFLSLPWPHAGLIIPCGIAGLILCTRGSRQREVFALFVLLGAISIVLFKASGRYRLPTLVLLAPLAAAVAIQMFGFIRENNRQAALRIGVIILTTGLIAWPDWQNIHGQQTARHDFFIGLWKQRLGQMDMAVAAYGKSMERHPWDADSPRWIGEIRLAEGKLDEAGRFFSEALKREPNFPEVTTALAQIAFRKENVPEADALTDRSLALYPNDERSLLLKARIREKQGRTNEELALYEKAIEEQGSPTVMIGLGLRLEELGKLQEALTWYGRVSETPTYSAFDRARAQMLAGFLFARKTGNIQRAQQMWQALLERFSSETFFVQQALFLLGEIDEEEYRKRNAQMPSRLVQEFECFNIGFARKLAGKEREAREMFQRCLGDTANADQPGTDSLPRRWAREELDKQPGNAVAP